MVWIILVISYLPMAFDLLAPIFFAYYQADPDRCTFLVDPFLYDIQFHLSTFDIALWYGHNLYERSST